jgi:NAD(P)-dependent dehydrogenase (short-subunit alcohol dehydrogenase family)
MGRVLATKFPNVVANAILPGVVVTPEGHWQEVISSDPERAERYLAERCPLGRFGQINEISTFVGYLSSKENSFSHGSIIPLDGGQAKGLINYSYLG